MWERVMEAKHIFYFAPHQDDELTNLGVPICKDLSEGRDVHVVLCTDGSASSVTRMLKDGGCCLWHEGEHRFDLNITEFVAARDAEFRASCEMLGIKAENVHISTLRAKDGKLTTENATDIILDAISGYEKESVVIKAIDPETEKYQNPDHTAVGKAAKAVKDSERASDAVFYYEFIHLPEEKDTRRFIYIEPTKEEKEKIKKAADSYRFWAPERGRYAVGYHSVADEFNDFLLHTLAAVLRK